MRKFILEKSTNILQFETFVPYTPTDSEVSILTDKVPRFFINKWNDTDWEEAATPEQIAEFTKVPVPETNTPAEFIYGLERQDANEDEVLDFIETQIEDVDTKLKARILFKKAIEFERYNPVLNSLIGAFNQFRGFLGKQPIDLDLLFITGKKLTNITP